MSLLSEIYSFVRSGQLELPTESATGICFLELYIKSILAIQHSAKKRLAFKAAKIPFVIMSSDYTHSRIQELLTTNDCFGMCPDQIYLLKQVGRLSSPFNSVSTCLQSNLKM